MATHNHLQHQRPPADHQENPFTRKVHIHQTGHVCPVCDRSRLLQQCVLSADLQFVRAFDVWISQRVLHVDGMTTNAQYLSERTEWDYRQYARALAKFFGTLRLDEIHSGHLREYQRARAFCDQTAGAWVKQAGANRIRKEVALLERVMKSSGAWTEELERNFKKVTRVEVDVPRAMTPEEQHAWLHTAAAADPFIYQYSLLALQTTASTNELRALRLGDIMLHQGVIQVRRVGAKNKFRIRTIPLESPEVVWALDQLVERAREMGASGPQHCLFPIQVARGSYNPNVAMSDSGLKKRWEEVRIKAGLRWLRPYDLRHTAITRLAEAGTPIDVIMSMAGHMTLRMHLHYTTISMMSKRRWAQAAWGAEPQLVPPRRPAARSIDAHRVG